ncbi:alanine--tRNA ligase [Rubrobacter taiwanensis]|uniref:Alanine--tRNA ligase n=1 Tax=Rubrobacter taiwanensis TaxID=185139 RepID=A0A4R1BHH9_9ACTN|nr:alanine--tRNA ligase [Rubrobacter taiwanensis]TCJ16689.1 alanine--tRNA ligase [Rubrobacter taiwanensis]
MKSHEIRRRFLDFFVERDHRLYPSSSLIPHNDPTVLLTTAGMQQFITYFLGQEKPPAPRATSVQKCFRTQDLEEVGDPSHLTFFEMLGNFSFGDYFKKEAIEWAWEFLTQELGIPGDRLWITIFEGDESAPEDVEAREHWMAVGVPEERIFGLPKSENWWGPPGDSGPCGPCSEVYYDYGEEYGAGDPLKDPKYGPGGDEGDGRFLEIWNLVFNQYEQLKDGTLRPLAKTGIDTGMGLERTAAVMQGVRTVYDTDLYAPIFERAAEYVGIRRGESEAADRALYILADHARGMAFLIADGVRPGNQHREYVLRRIIRRATREAYSRLGMSAGQVAGLAEAVVDYMGEHYPELKGARDEIGRVVTREAQRFIEIYEQGARLLEGELQRLQGGSFPGEVAFTLHDTYGFPVEVTREILAERGVSLDEAGFERAMREQRERARAAQRGYERAVAAFGDLEVESRFVGYEREQVETRILALEPAPDTGGEFYLVLEENPFYATGGGQVADVGWISGEGGELEVVDSIPAGDYQVLRARVKEGELRPGDVVTASINRVRRQQIEANHTATHILHWALRAVLGKEVVQAGSYVGPDRLRFDYRYSGQVTDEDIARVQEQAVLKITENQPVRYYITTLEEARNLGAIMLFGEKYGDLVRVVEIDGFSRELCGGTHVSRTAEIGAFKVLSNRKHGADLYRIEVITGREAIYYLLRTAGIAERLASELNVEPARLPEVVSGLRREAQEARRAAERQVLRSGLEAVGELVQNAETVDGARIVVGKVVAPDVKALRQLTDDVKNRVGGPAAAVLAAELDGKAVVVANLHDEVARKVRAGDLVRAMSEILGGGGGGGPTMAQGGGGDAAAVPRALDRARELLRERLASGA